VEQADRPARDQGVLPVYDDALEHHGKPFTNMPVSRRGMGKG
jgi:hypothetical protein